MISVFDSREHVRTKIAGCCLTSLVREHSVPLVIFDAAAMLSSLTLPESLVAVRYNASVSGRVAILDRIRTAGAGILVTSADELRRALQVQGLRLKRVPSGVDDRPSQRAIVYSADGFDDSSLDLIEQHAIHVHCGSADMIDHLGQRRPGAEITLRVQANASTLSQTHAAIGSGLAASVLNAGGITLEQVEDCLFRADQYGISVTGIETTSCTGDLREGIASACEATTRFASIIGRTLSKISINVDPFGGERPWVNEVSPRQYREMWDETRQSISRQLGHAIELEHVVGNRVLRESCYLIVVIRAVKKLGGIRCYVVDGDIDPWLNASSDDIPSVAICPRDGSEHDRPAVDALLVGSRGGAIGERLIGKLPIALAGDYVVLSRLPRAPHNLNCVEVLIENEIAKVIRSRQPYDECVRGESVPE